MEYKNTLEKYFYTTITSVTIYAAVNLLLVLNEYFKKKKKKHFLSVFFGGQGFFEKKKKSKKNTSVFFELHQSLSTKCHPNQPFAPQLGEGMHVVSEDVQEDREGDALEDVGASFLRHRPAPPAAGGVVSPTPREDALTKRPLDYFKEEKQRQHETNRWLEHHFGSDSGR